MAAAISKTRTFIRQRGLRVVAVQIAPHSGEASASVSLHLGGRSATRKQQTSRAYLLTLLIFRRVYGFADNVVVDLFGRLGLCRFCRGRWRSRWRCLWLYWRTSRHWWCRRLIAQWHYRWRNPSLGWGDRRRGGRRDGKRLRRRLRDSLPHPNRLHSDRGRPSTRPMIQQNEHNPRQTKPQKRAKQSRNVQITLAKVQRGLRVFSL